MNFQTKIATWARETLKNLHFRSKIKSLAEWIDRVREKRNAKASTTSRRFSRTRSRIPYFVDSV